MEHPTLRYPDPNCGYTLFMDASSIGWAGVLTQEFEDNKGKKKHHPICYVVQTIGHRKSLLTHVHT